MSDKKINSIAVIGAGAWGTALARLLVGKGHPVALWFYDKAVFNKAKRNKENPFLLGFDLSGLELTTDLANAVKDKDLIILANPAQNNRAVLRAAKPYLKPRAIILNVSKGIELKTFALMSDLVKAEAPKHYKHSAYLSGPSFAHELALKKITIVSIAARDLKIARQLQSLLAAAYFRPYITKDIVGVQIGGAVKNVIAVAAGIAAGLGEGENTQAALVTRGLAEISRLGLALGAKRETFMGAAGLGDLLLTARSGSSRNYNFGLAVGQGKKPAELIKHSKQAVEGYWTTQAVWQRAHSLKVEMAITDGLYKILFQRKSPRAVIENLMKRELKAE